MVSIGQKYGRLTVTSEGPRGCNNTRRVYASCECGGGTLVYASNLQGGKTKSCGCGQKGNTPHNKTHGMSTTKIYMCWSKMWDRCTNKNYHHYQDYGGRGITVCDAWKSFETFYSDMGDIPEGGTLDRRNNDLGYSATNCKWSTPSEQGNNRRSTVVLTHNGVSKPLTIWASEIGIHRHTLANRIRLGWSHSRALTESLRPY